jgi:hypothetical protein
MPELSITAEAAAAAATWHTWLIAAGLDTFRPPVASIKFGKHKAW